MWQLLVWISLFLVSFSARADYAAYPGQFHTGNSLVRLMQEPDNNMLAKGEALGFVLAVFDHGMYSRWNTLATTKNIPQAKTPEFRAAMTELFFCEPNGITKGQVVAVVKKFLEQNPERWSEPAHRLVEDALKKAFPCKVQDLFPNS